MYNNDYMYAIERSPEYLAHYGIRGMKWGVRKAIASGNSAKLSKQYAKAQKKLAKLEKQAGKSKKYARRAALMGAGAAAAGGLAALGTEGVGKLYRGVGKGAANVMGKGGTLMSRAGDALRAYGRTPGKGSKIKRIATSAGMKLNSAGKSVSGAAMPVNTAAVKGSNAIVKWGRSTNLSNSVGNSLVRSGGVNMGKALKGANAHGSIGYKLGNAQVGLGTKINKAGISNNTIARIGAGVVGAGLAAGAAHNAYKAATAQKKAEKFRAAMNESFKGTKYANGGNRQGKKRRK